MESCACLTALVVVPADENPPSLTRIRRPLPEMKHQLDEEASKTWVYPINLPIRNYQRSIVAKCLFQNTLVALPTGLGKTFIAGVMMLNCQSDISKAYDHHCSADHLPFSSPSLQTTVGSRQARSSLSPRPRPLSISRPRRSQKRAVSFDQRVRRSWAGSHLHNGQPP